MKLILVRHGETLMNKKDIRQGHTHNPLSAAGRKQAQKVAKELKKEGIAAIYSSDIRRAADTARVVAKLHKNVPLILTRDLRERNPGIYDNTPMSAEREASKASGLEKHKWRPPGGE